MPASRNDDWFTFGLVWGLGVILPPVSLALPAAYYGWKGLRAVAAKAARASEAAAERRKEAERERQESERVERLHRLELAAATRRPSVPPPPPPPTREEREAAIHARYETALRRLDSPHLDETERRAGREKAKQQFLRDLDTVL